LPPELALPPKALMPVPPVLGLPATEPALEKELPALLAVPPLVFVSSDGSSVFTCVAHPNATATPTATRAVRSKADRCVVWAMH
jgi:hypothetical protein